MKKLTTYAKKSGTGLVKDGHEDATSCGNVGMTHIVQNRKRPGRRFLPFEGFYLFHSELAGGARQKKQQGLLALLFVTFII